MAAISVGGAINEGFSLIGRAPGAVLLWGGVQMALTLLVALILGPVYYGIFQAVQAGAAADPNQLVSTSGSIQAFSLLIDVVELVVYSVVYCAVFRAVLHPEQGQFGYMRLSMPELLVGAMLFGGYFVVAIGVFFGTLVVMIPILILAALKVYWAAVLFGVAAGIAAFVGLFYFVLRVSLVGPAIVDEGRLDLTEAWRLTRGHVGSLFLIGLVIALVAAAGEIIVGIVMVALGLGVLAGMAGGMSHIGTLFQGQSPAALLARLGPLLVLFAAIWTPFMGGLFAIAGAPWARAYRDLKPQDMSATFA
jgi:hypothetical protein